LKEVQSSCLDRNTVFLEYSLGDSSSYLWVITREDHQLFKLPDRKTIQEQIETLRFALLNPKQSNIGFFTQSGFSLYRQIIQPAEQFFSKKSKLVIIPDGILNYLPFELLITEEQQENTEGSYSDLPYLVKKYPISYGQSSSVLKSLIEEQKRAGAAGKSSKKLIAFGDPVYEKKDNVSFITREGLSRLEHSGIEVEKIASLFPDGDSNTYLREKATEENVKREGELAKFSYIHFATHGLIDEQKPDFSCLVLTQDEDADEDGFLQAAEIFNLNMDADLVVLSACQTGLGKMVRGEGMVGLTRAFMYAGTPSVLVSLWSVSDVSTASFMEKFYSQLIVGKLTKTEALQKAQLSLIKEEQYAHPFYWAPFVLIGNWK
jgi:CHAT domain-containing protein